MSSKVVQFQSQQPNPNMPQVLDISPEDVLNHVDAVKIIDVRRPDEWVGEFGHIEQSELITLDTLPSRLGDIPQDKTVVFVCRSGGRSAQATAFALENGYTTVFNMRGGMIAWTQNNFKAVEKNGS